MLTLRRNKGTPLTHAEMDDNLQGLADGTNWSGTLAASVASLTVTTGNLTVSAGQLHMASGSITAPAIVNAGSDDGLYFSGVSVAYAANNQGRFAFSGDAFVCRSTATIGFNAANEPLTAADTILARDAANTLAQRNGTNAQAYRNYGRFVSASDANYCEIAHATTTLASVSGATVTATSLIPDGAIVVGISTTVTVALGTTGGTTGYQVGDGSDADRWGTVTGTTAGTDTDNTDWTTTTIPLFTAAQNIVITANGGNFDGTGSIFIDVSYLRGISV